MTHPTFIWESKFAEKKLDGKGMSDQTLREQVYFTDNQTIQAYEYLKTLDMKEFIAYVKDAGSPTHGPLAAAVWHGLSSSSKYALFGPSVAGTVYRECGYIPFCGYPLERNPSFK